MATTTTTNTPIVGRTPASGTSSALPSVAPFTINQTIVTNTTTVDSPLGNVVTNYSYIPNMRSINIDYVGYKLRPLRKVYHYFDDNMVNSFIQRPNIIEISSNNAPVDIMSGHREWITIGTSTARVLHTELNTSSGNTVLYVAEFNNPASIVVGSTISSQNSSFSSKVVSYQHNSGIANSCNTTSYAGYGSNVTLLGLSADANNTVDGYYTGNVFTILSGKMSGTSVEIVDYISSTKTVILSPALTSNAAGQFYSIGDARTSWSSNNTQSTYITERGYDSGVLHIPDPSLGILVIPTGSRVFRILDNPRNDIKSYTTRADYNFVTNGTNLTTAQIIERNSTTTINDYVSFKLEPTPTPSITPTKSITPSVTKTPTKTPTNTPSVTPTISLTPTRSPTPGVSLTPTQSITPTPSITPTATVTPTLTPTSTLTPTTSITPTRTVTPSGTFPLYKYVGFCTAFNGGNGGGKEDIAADYAYVCDFNAVTGSPQLGNPVPWQHPSRFRYVSDLPNGSYPGSIPQPIRGTPNVNLACFDPLAGGALPVVNGTTYPYQSTIVTGGDNWSIGKAGGVDIYSAPAGTAFGIGGGPIDWGNLTQAIEAGIPARKALATGENYIQYYDWQGIWQNCNYQITGMYVHPFMCHSGYSHTCAGLPYDPIAQTFTIDPSTNPNGVFISSVDLYFLDKGTLPLEVQIRTVENGYPSSNTVVPGAVIILPPEKINVAEIPNVQNSMTATKFTFSSPVYLSPGFDYALTVVTDDYNYDIFVAEKGKTVLGTDRVLSASPYMGAMFRSQNQKSWSFVTDEQLMFTLYKCYFPQTTIGSVILQEDKDRQAKQTSANVVYDSLELQSDAIQLPGTALNYYFKGMSNTTMLVDTVYIPFKPDNRYDVTSDRKLLLKASDSNYSFTSRIDMSTLNNDVSPQLFHNRQNLVLIENLINNTGLTGEKFTITNPGDGTYNANVEIAISSPVGYGANVYGQVVSGNVANIIIRSAGTGYVDAVYANVVSTDGFGNNATIAVSTEVQQSGGPALARYISQTVTLLDGFDAGDLRVYIDAVKPAGSNVQVYYKVRNTHDSDPIEKKYWTRMVQATSQYTYSLTNEQIEYEYRPSMNSNNIVYSTNTATYGTFNQFAIKIVLASDGTLASNLPYVYDVRAIALPADVY